MSSDKSEEGGVRRFIVRQVAQTVRCGACGARYRDEDLSILENSDNVWMLMAVCPGCDTQALIMVVVRDALPEPEPQPALNVDDVLDFHSLLVEHHGDVRTLLEGSG